MKLFIILLAFISACSFPTIEDQEWATKIVWNEGYGSTSNPPQIEWFEQDRLNCFERDGRFIGWKPYSNSDICVGGLYHDGVNLVQLAHPTNFKFSNSAFAHELWHAYLKCSTGDSDNGHKDPGFGPSGIVTKTNENLVELGL